MRDRGVLCGIAGCSREGVSGMEVQSERPSQRGSRGERGTEPRRLAVPVISSMSRAQEESVAAGGWW